MLYGGRAMMTAPGAEVFDAENGLLRGPGGTVELTPLELRLLAALVRRAGKLCTRDYLVMEVWPDEQAPASAYEKALNGLVGRTREKLALAGLGAEMLHTRRLMGYEWRPDWGRGGAGVGHG